MNRRASVSLLTARCQSPAPINKKHSALNCVRHWQAARRRPTGLDRGAVSQSVGRKLDGGRNNLLVVIDVCAKVRAILSECTCVDQFPMIRIAEGKYCIGHAQTLVFLRVSKIVYGYRNS